MGHYITALHSDEVFSLLYYSIVLRLVTIQTAKCSSFSFSFEMQG